jgi:hypothetical protein
MKTEGRGGKFERVLGSLAAVTLGRVRELCDSSRAGSCLLGSGSEGKGMRIGWEWI